ncbi:MAG: PHP domain-containing protein, partial [Chloroflexi bacterium]|nr:PHP domain-containing protein [Chloroflexota bacterium]
MKKIDLHIHTISTNSDCYFEFSIEQLKNYIEKREIDGIAITNHNHFDLEQFQLISDSLTIVTFPGIEIDLGKGHILLISDVNEFEDFNEKCNTLSNTISNGNGSISFQELQEVFQDLSRYILIPHYRKNPEIDDETLRQLRPYISAGEVPSVKKFIYCQKDPDSIVPVMFSDIRCSNTISEFPPRQTYIDAGDISFGALRTCLRDKNKVFLSEKDGHKFFDALDTGLRLSTGLNVILGERSSGKTYTLNRLFSSHENVKYIEQFSLLVRDEQTDV